jgi:FkbM family methyltransferase
MIAKRPIQIVLLVKNWLPFLADYCGLIKTGKVKCFLRNGVKFLMRTKSKDKSVILEVWVDKCYNPPGFEIHENDLVVDVRAHIGSFSIYAARLAKQGLVYSIEPVSDNFELLERNAELNGITNIVPVNKAITESSGQREIFVQLEDTTMHSFYNPKGEARKTLVRTTTLEDFIRDYSIDKIDFLKMDCEGSEYEIFMGCPNEILDKIERISMESHPMSGNRNQKMMATYLERRGFKVILNPKIGTLYAFRRENKR